MTRQVWPYRRPPAHSVAASDWQILVADASQDLPQALPYWDYRTNISLRRQVSLDMDEVLRVTDLAVDAELCLAITWTASGSSLRAPAGRVVLPSVGCQKIEVGVELPGDHLGGTVTVRTVLVLIRPGSTSSPVAPRRAGSVLWADEVRVRLQGDAPQFPIAIVDFEQTSFPKNAAWHLELGTRLDAAAMGALLLYVNERNKAVVRAFQNAAAPKPADRLILSAVYADVARIMVEEALNNHDIDDDSEFGDETLGQTLQNLVGRLFPGRSIRDLRSLRDHSPHQLASQIQAAVGVFQEN